MDLWATARQDLGLSDEEFLNYPAAMIYALRRRYLAKLQREEMLLGQLNCTVANFSFSPPRKTLTPDMFMLHPLKIQREERTLGDSLLAELQALPPGVVQRVN